MVFFLRCYGVGHSTSPETIHFFCGIQEDKKSLASAPTLKAKKRKKPRHAELGIGVGVGFGVEAGPGAGQQTEVLEEMCSVESLTGTAEKEQYFERDYVNG